MSLRHPVCKDIKGEFTHLHSFWDTINCAIYSDHSGGYHKCYVLIERELWRILKRGSSYSPLFEQVVSKHLEDHGDIDWNSHLPRELVTYYLKTYIKTFEEFAAFINTEAMQYEDECNEQSNLNINK